MSQLDQLVDPSVPRPILPCNYFDLIAGTSTGGLIAVMLGVLHMDVDTCIAEYIKLGPRIFPKEGKIAGSKVSRLVKVLSKKSRFNPESLEIAIQEMVEERLVTRSRDGKDTMMRFEAEQAGGPQCKVYVENAMHRV